MNSLSLQSMALILGLQGALPAQPVAGAAPLSEAQPPAVEMLAARATAMPEDTFQLQPEHWAPYTRQDTLGPVTSEAATVGPTARALVEHTLTAVASRTEKPSQNVCYRYVKKGIAAATGLQLTGKSAYQAADQLAASDKFQEWPRITPEQLQDLPAGAVVVWNRGTVYGADGKPRTVRQANGKRVAVTRPHGHIAIVVGDTAHPKLDAARRAINKNDPGSVKLEVSDRLRDLDKMESYGTRWSGGDQGTSGGTIRVFVPRELASPHP